VPMGSGGRFVFYTNELVGLGHLRRQLALAGQLAREDGTASSLIVTGSPVEPYFELPPRVDVVKLPARIRDEEGQHRGLLGVALEELQALRSGLAVSAAMALEPNVAVVEKLPLGITGELRPTLEALRTLSGCKIVLGLRDIDERPDRVRANWVGMRSAVDRYYDAVLVYGPPGSPDAIACMGWDDLGVPVHHVGYVSAAMPPTEPPNGRAGYVLATAGSGRSGFKMLSAFLDALALSPLPYPSILVTGPLMDVEQKEELRRRGSGLDVEVWEFRTDITRLIAGARAIVGMAGYNTVAEFIRARRPALVVPRVRPSEEQLIRARYLEQEGLAAMLHPDGLSASSMRAALDHLLTRPAPPWRPDDFRGTEVAAGILLELAGAGTPAAAPAPPRALAGGS